MDRTTVIEERLAHLERVNDDLSRIVAEQRGAIDRLEARLARLMAREAEREIDAGGTAPLADRPPPHW